MPSRHCDCDCKPVWCRRCLTNHMPSMVLGVLPVVECPKQERGVLDIVPSPQFPRAIGPRVDEDRVEWV